MQKNGKFIKLNFKNFKNYSQKNSFWLEKREYL